MFKNSSNFTRSAVALLALAGAGAMSLSAQQAAPSTASTQKVDLSVPAIDTSRESLFSSSADENVATPVTEASLHPAMVNFAEAMQYGGGQRKRYGKTRYRGANSNADGSSKYIFFGGAGLSQPIGNTFHYLTPSYGIQVGGGRQFNKHFALPVELNYDHFGFAKETLDNQFALYNAAGANFTSLDGSSHVWSFSVDPTYTVYSGEGLGAYLVAGVGFYHKTATFTIPGQGEYCDEFGYCYTYTANEPVDSYTSNAPGYSGGIGLTYKISRFANERFYVEARYVFVQNSQRYGYTVNDITYTNARTNASQTFDVNNFYPANSNRTSYIPFKAGIRF